MKTEIERIALTLPAGFADRAPAIARLLGQALAEQAESAGLGPGDARHAVVDVGRVRVDARDSDRLIAGSIAGAIAAVLRSGVGNRASSTEDASCSRR